MSLTYRVAVRGRFADLSPPQRHRLAADAAAGALAIARAQDWLRERDLRGEALTATATCMDVIRTERRGRRART